MTIFQEKSDCHALADVEDIFIFGAVRATLLFQGVAVEIQHVDFIKRVHQMLAHATERGTIQIGVIGDHTDDTLYVANEQALGQDYRCDQVQMR